MPDTKYDTLEDVIEEVRKIWEAGENRDDLKSFLYRQILLNGLKIKRDELGTLDLKAARARVTEIAES